MSLEEFLLIGAGSARSARLLLQPPSKRAGFHVSHWNVFQRGWTIEINRICDPKYCGHCWRCRSGDIKLYLLVQACRYFLKGFGSYCCILKRWYFLLLTSVCVQTLLLKSLRISEWVILWICLDPWFCEHVCFFPKRRVADLCRKIIDHIHVCRIRIFVRHDFICFMFIFVKFKVLVMFAFVKFK